MIQDDLYAKAAEKASALHTSVPDVVADYLRQWIAQGDRQGAARAAMRERFAKPDWQFAVGVLEDRERRMRGVEFFLDSNVLLYAISTLPMEAGKAAAARQILDQMDWASSAQVAAEFINVSTSVKRPDRLSLMDAESWIVTWLAFPFAAIDAETVKLALGIAARSKISYFDAQIIAAAKQLGCSTIYSEDFNDGQDYGGIRVVNPFRAVGP